MLKIKELENTQIIDDLGYKLNYVESEKNQEVFNYEERIKKEYNDKNKYANLCSDLLRIIELKDK